MHFQARSLPRSTFEPDVNVEIENKPLTIARPVYLESENRAEKRCVDRISLGFLKVYYLSFSLSLFLSSVNQISHHTENKRTANVILPLLSSSYQTRIRP